MWMLLESVKGDSPINKKEFVSFLYDKADIEYTTTSCIGSFSGERLKTSLTFIAIYDLEELKDIISISKNKYGITNAKISLFTPDENLTYMPNEDLNPTVDCQLCVRFFKDGKQHSGFSKKQAEDLLKYAIFE